MGTVLKLKSGNVHVQYNTFDRTVICIFSIFYVTKC